MQESAASIRGLCRIQHNIRINIHQKHTERNRNKEQRLKTFRNREIEKGESHRNHDEVSECDGEKCGLMDKIAECIG